MTRSVLGFVLVAVGLVWVGQGLGFIRGGSFMVDDIRWAAAGVVTALLGAALLWRSWRGRDQEHPG